MGYLVSDLYSNKIYKEDSIQTIDILANDKKIECIRKLEYKDDIFETDNFTLGSAISSEIKLEIDNDILNEAGDFDEVSIQTNLLIDEENDVYESVPIGSYIVKTKDTSTKEYTKLTLYDYMDKLNVEFDASSIVPCTRYELLKAICDYCNLELYNEAILNGDVIVNVYDNTLLAKTYVSFIAERAGGFAKVIRDKLYIRNFNELDEHILPSELGGEHITNELKKITKVVYENGIQKFEKGTDDGETIYLSQESPFSCAQKEVDNIYEKLNGLQFQSLDVKIWGNPAIDTGDKIKYKDIVSFAQKNWSWGNGFYGSYKTTLNKIDKISSVSKISSNNKIKKIQSNIDETEGRISIIAEEVDETTEKINNINNQIIPTSIALGSNIHIEDGSDNDMISLKLDGRSTQETRSGKNLLNNVATTQTINGVTFTVNEDKSVTVKGTATAKTSLILATDITLSAGTYYLKGVIGGGSLTYAFTLAGAVSLYNGSRSFTVAEEKTYANAFIYITSGVSVDTTIYPMIVSEENKDADYEQYGVMPSPDYPSEIKSVGYKNLLPKGTSKTSNGITYTILDDGSISLNGTSTSTSFLSIKLPKTILSGAYITWSANNPVANANVGIRLHTETASIDETYHTLDIINQAYTAKIKNVAAAFAVRIASGTTLNDFIIKPQLEEGSIAHPYIPYGKYGVEVVNTGKNLLNLLDTTITNTNLTYNVVDGVINVSGTYSSGSSLILAIDLTLPAGTYTLSTNAGNYPYVRLYSNDVIAISTAYADKGVKTFTLDKETKFNKIYFYIGNASYPSVIKPQIEVGVSNSQWELYKSTTTFFELDEPLRSPPNGTKDKLIVENGIVKKIRRIYKKVFDGSESWYLALTNDNTNMYYLQLEHISESLMSNYFTQNSNLYNDDIEGIRGNANNNRIWIRSKLKTIDEFKSWLSENTPEVIYELENEEVIEIGEIEQPKTYQGINNISNSEDANMTIEYVRDTVLSDYVEGQINNAVIVQERKNAELEITNDQIRSSVSEVSTKLNNDYTNNQELDQKLEEQKQTITEEYSTLITQTKESWQASVINYINQNGVEKFVNTLVTIDIDGLKLSKSDEDIVSLLNNKGLYVSDGKLREDLTNLLMKVDRSGALFKLLEVLGTIKEQEMIQKEKITDDTYGECQAWYWIGE